MSFHHTLDVSPVQIIPACDHTVPLSTSTPRPRRGRRLMRNSDPSEVSPRQSLSSLILASSAERQGVLLRFAFRGSAFTLRHGYHRVLHGCCRSRHRPGCEHAICAGSPFTAVCVALHVMTCPPLTPHTQLGPAAHIGSPGNWLLLTQAANTSSAASSWMSRSACPCYELAGGIGCRRRAAEESHLDVFREAMDPENQPWPSPPYTANSI